MLFYYKYVIIKIENPQWEKEDSMFRTKSGLTGEHIAGNKTPILFAHGMWEGSWVFKNWMQEASNSGHEVFALNLRGHHNSKPCKIGKVSILDYVEDVQETLQHIGRPVILVGHSMGGLITQIVASQKNDLVEKVVFVATAPPNSVWLKGPVITSMLRHPGYLWDMMRSRELMIRLPEFADLEGNNLESPESSYTKLVPESGRAAWEIVSLQISVPNLYCPSLVISGAKDRMTVPGIQRKVALRYGSQFEEFPNGHMMMLEDGWEKPIHRILQFTEV